MFSMNEEEKRLRVELAACYRIFAMLGWTELIYNHITVRVSGPNLGSEEHFLINPFGLHYTEVTASNLVKIDVKGNVVDGSNSPVNPAGFTVHAAIHSGIENAHCVMHTHTTSGMAVAASAVGLCPNNFYSAMLSGQVAYHDFEGITVHEDEGPRLVKAIGDCPLVILRNHGLLAWGLTIPQAFAYLWTLQRACDVQVAGAALGLTLAISEDVKMKSQRDALQFKNSPGKTAKTAKTATMGAGEDVFAALVRMVDKIDVSYKL
jgi:ribulose-5-phosphate 4-epimerase/fuculose-1-phosphate aldolase